MCAGKLSERKVAELEALLFIAGEPIEIAEIEEILGLDQELTRGALNWLKLKLLHGRSPLCLRQAKGRYFLALKEDYQPIAKGYFRPEREHKLSPQAYEVLAAVAYLQPVTRAQIEEVRGVNSDHLVNRLRDAGLIETTGQAELPGRPQLFAVSERFWQEFGYGDVNELPPLDLSMYTDLTSLTELTLMDSVLGAKRDSEDLDNEN